MSIPHLPECPCTAFSDDEFCVCPALRACEQRVREARGAWLDGYSAGLSEDVWRQGYAAALDAARAEVAALDSTYLLDMSVNRAEALAAIDALRGNYNA